MFTGIVKGLFKVEKWEPKPHMASFGIGFNAELLQGLQLGASVAVDGVCLTVTRIDGHRVWFDAIQETLNKTTLKFLQEGRPVNIERSARFGDEIGGHLLSGHIFGTARIHHIKQFENNKVVVFHAEPGWMKYFFPKGYIALDGVSLTLVDVNPEGTFSVHLIPETLRLTRFGSKIAGDLVNVELDAQTQAIVDTVERLYGNCGVR